MNCCFQAKHPGCLEIPQRFQLNTYLGTLADGLGLFPSRRVTLAPLPHSQEDKVIAFGVCQDLVGGEAPSHSVLYLYKIGPRLFLKTFRGERAISSLISLSPLPTGHRKLFNVQLVRSSRFCVTFPSTCPWVDHRFRVYIHRLSPYSDLLSLRLLPV